MKPFLAWSLLFLKATWPDGYLRKKDVLFSKGLAGSEAMRKKNCMVAHDVHRIDPIVAWLRYFQQYWT